MNDIYKTPESQLAAEPEPRTYDIPGIKRYRWMMLASLAVFYFSSQFLRLGYVEPTFVVMLVQTVGQTLAGLINMVMFAILAGKVYQKTWVVLLCIVLSLVPLVNLIACLFMSVRSKEVINYAGRRRQRFG